MLSLYEMTSGSRPFRGQTVFELSAAILQRQPPPLPSHTPPPLQRVIERCLEKERARRYHQASDVRAALDAIRAGGVAAAAAPRRVTRRLAVLPLRDLSGNPGEAYFIDGTHEALITDLARLGSLRVIARASMMRYKDSQKPLAEIARELNVDTVLTGSVLRAGNRVRITAQLLDTGTEEHLWAGRYDRELRDVLEVQNEIVAAIARDVQLQVTPSEQAQLTRARPVDPGAYEAYLKGRFHWYKLARDHQDTALGYFEQALERDPNCALAHAGIAATWASRADTGSFSPMEALSKAKTAIAKALALDATLPQAYECSANLKFCHEWDWFGAEEDFQRAIRLNPSYADAHLFYADFLVSMRRFQEAEAESERALELDPLSSFLHCFRGWHLVYVRRYDDAVAQLETAVTAEPDFAAAHLGLWGAFYRQRMYEEAVREARTFFAQLGDHEIERRLVGGSGADAYSDAMRRAADTLAGRARRSYVPAVRIARLYAHAADTDQTIDWLEQAYVKREPPLIHLSVGWDWDLLRGDPRFQDLLRRMNLPVMPITSEPARRR